VFVVIFEFNVEMSEILSGPSLPDTAKAEPSGQVSRGWNNTLQF
jgi:hypothetical protein